MNDSVLVWGGVAVLVLIAVILYCLWRLLTRRPAAPGVGGVTVATSADPVRVGHRQSGQADPELAGIDLDDARARARAAALQRADQRQMAASTAFSVGDTDTAGLSTDGAGTAGGTGSAGDAGDWTFADGSSVADTQGTVADHAASPGFAAEPVTGASDVGVVASAAPAVAVSAGPDATGGRSDSPAPGPEAALDFGLDPDPGTDTDTDTDRQRS